MSHFLYSTIPLVVTRVIIRETTACFSETLYVEFEGPRGNVGSTEAILD